MKFKFVAEGETWEGYHEELPDKHWMFCWRRPAGCDIHLRDERMPYGWVRVYRNDPREKGNHFSDPTDEYRLAHDAGPLELLAIAYEMREKHSVPNTEHPVASVQLR